VDRYGRLRAVTFMRTALFGDDGRHGLAEQLREAITEAQAGLKTAVEPREAANVAEAVNRIA
jgi:hypothetical protein